MILVAASLFNGCTRYSNGSRQNRCRGLVMNYDTDCRRRKRRGAHIPSARKLLGYRCMREITVMNAHLQLGSQLVTAGSSGARKEAPPWENSEVRDSRHASCSSGMYEVQQTDVGDVSARLNGEGDMKYVDAPAVRGFLLTPSCPCD